MRLKGKTALITGGFAGIGFGTAKRFLKEGAMAYITGRRIEKLKEAVNQLWDGVHCIAAAVTFFASDEASYITGSEIPVDGGMTRIFAGRL